LSSTGRLVVRLIDNRNYVPVQGCLLAIGLTYVVVNLLPDLVYRWTNPRMRAKCRFEALPCSGRKNATQDCTPGVFENRGSRCIGRSNFEHKSARRATG
jgi:hypothetical protein